MLSPVLVRQKKKNDKRAEIWGLSLFLLLLLQHLALGFSILPKEKVEKPSSWEAPVTWRRRYEAGLQADEQRGATVQRWLSDWGLSSLCSPFIPATSAFLDQVLPRTRHWGCAGTETHGQSIHSLPAVQ